MTRLLPLSLLALGGLIGCAPHAQPNSDCEWPHEIATGPLSAQVGDLLMSLIHTCQLCGANSFDYLTQLQRHSRELADCPAEWMPWNYQQTLTRTEV